MKIIEGELKEMRKRMKKIAAVLAMSLIFQGTMEAVTGMELAESPVEAVEQGFQAEIEDAEEFQSYIETGEAVLDVFEASAADVRQTYETVGKKLAGDAFIYTPNVSSMNGEWQIMGLARSGQAVDPSVYSKYKENVLKTVQECQGVLHSKKYTEYSRVVLALTALGEDVTNVGGYNLLQPLSDFDQTVWQGINGAIWALIAFDSHNYEIPQADPGKTQNTREKLIRHILSKELSEGGWAMSGEKADPDVTGMAIQALARYRSKYASVNGAVNRALERLSSLQNEDGGYSSWGYVNSESCSQVIVALTSLGIDPLKDERFLKNGNSVVDALVRYKTTDGGFAHVKGNGTDQMATEQGYYALTSYFRLLEGKTSLYDMNDVAIKVSSENPRPSFVPILEVPGKLKSLTIKSGNTVRFSLIMENGDSIASVKSNNKKYVKSSFDKNKGTVSLKAVKKGSAKVTIVLASGKTRTYTVKVTTGTVKTTNIKVENTKVTLIKGKTLTLKPVLTPFTSTEKITYKSSNTKVATVSSAGKIKAVAAGKAKITVASGSRKVTVAVTVKKG